jgi:hypothetical protein
VGLPFKAPMRESIDHDMFSLIEEALPVLLKRIREQRRMTWGAPEKVDRV